MGEADDEPNKYVSIAYVRSEGCYGEKQCREVDGGCFPWLGFHGLRGPRVKEPHLEGYQNLFSEPLPYRNNSDDDDGTIC